MPQSFPSPFARRRARRHDPARVRAALTAEVTALRATVATLTCSPAADAILHGPTRLGDWTVRDLVVHLAMGLEALPERLEAPAPTGPVLDLREWLRGQGELSEDEVRATAGELARATAERAAALADGGPEAVSRYFEEAADRFAEALGPASGRTLVPIRTGAMTVDDFLVTRLLEAVVHADDLAAAVRQAVDSGDRWGSGAPAAAAQVHHEGAAPPLGAGPDAFPHDRQALAAVVRLLADGLAEQAPGGSVEVRVPPFAVVQCVQGPKHTRGTPPNVVETDPLTWIRLATGRLDWEQALREHSVSASGERADLGGVLPVVR
ncbi:sterol carrier family protein [Streptomyces sp. HB2AG]|uniref:sterol carrier family protein n=1 Tax=Streptomyces sp. HB2AG TaxID=2983400 RepID=UPI0022AAA05A|nr:sterol carrier family protein [Streptomyces sp. HB2AG]MCZ2523815.1 sterol carrier family protein [Streptomyces sp. HB2AG]